MRHHPALWWGTLRDSLRTAPRQSAAALAAIVLSSASALAVGPLLRASVEAAGPAVLPCALGLAAVQAAGVVGRETADELVATVADRTGRLVLQPRVHRWVAAPPGLEHLERGDVLDRVDIVHRSTGKIARTGWDAVRAAVHAVALGSAAALLAGVHPVSALLLPLALWPVWCEHRGRDAVRRAEAAGAEDDRVQRALFAAVTGPDAEVRAAGAAERLTGLQQEAWDRASRVRTRARFAAARWAAAGWSVFAAGSAAAVAVAARAGAGPGDLVLTAAVALALRQAMRGAADAAAETAGARRFTDPYLWLRRYAREHGGTPSPASSGPPPVLTRGVTLDRVSYTHPGTERPAVAGVSAHLPAGSVVALVGEHGSGKTTLVTLLLGFRTPGSGRVLVDGAPLTGWRDRAVAVFQDFGRYHLPLREAVGIGDPGRMHDPRAVDRALRAAGAEDVAAPDTLLGFDADLSEGQWQRVALARGSMRPAPLLFVLDEPTASLDAPAEEAVFRRAMARAREHADRTGAVTVVVSHRFSTVAAADLVLVLHRGRLVESGSHAELLASGGRYADLYGMQEDAYTAPPGEGTAREDGGTA